MNNYIFYFSGTGNSLYTAKLISAKDKNTELVSITRHIKNGYEIEKADTIGFVIPVYVFGAPIIVEEFIKKLKVNEYNYLYILFVHGGGPYSAVFNFKKKLSKAGFRVDAGYEVVSPENYIVGNNPPDIKKSIELLETTKEELQKVIEDVKTKKKIFPNIVFWKKILGMLLQPFFKSIASKASKKFSVSSNCNGCEICVKLCPREIISLNTDRQPEWKGNNCEMCYACINICPQKAIEIEKKTQGKNRYKNPEITVSELIVR